MKRFLHKSLMRRRAAALFACAMALVGKSFNLDPLSASISLDVISSGPQLDQFGILMLNPSVEPSSDWIAEWNVERRLTKTHQIDLYDMRCFARGKAVLSMGAGEVVMNGVSPRFYISATPNGDAMELESGWLNTEFTAYARVEAWGSKSAGFTLVSRTNHDAYIKNPCEAHGYYARIVFSSGFIYVKYELKSIVSVLSFL